MSVLVIERNNCNRYYHPETGRFISMDPIGLKGGDTNYYRYVGNNPINFVDPFGLTQEDIDLAFKFVRQTYPNAKDVSYRVATEAELGKGNVGKYDPLNNEVLLHQDYLKPLSSRQAADLLDTAYHEVGHSQNLLKAFGDALTPNIEGRDDYFHRQIYDQATIDTANSIKGYLNERKQCP